MATPSTRDPLDPSPDVETCSAELAAAHVACAECGQLLRAGDRITDVMVYKRGELQYIELYHARCSPHSGKAYV